MQAPPAGRPSRAMLVVGATLLLIGAVLFAGGAYIGCMNIATSDKDGYAVSAPYQVRTNASVFFLAVLPHNDPGDVVDTVWKVTARAAGRDLFVGWAWFADVENFTKGYMFETPLFWKWDYDLWKSIMEIPGGLIYNNATPAPDPSNRTFWLDRTRTHGPPGLTAILEWDMKWEPPSAKKALVIMNLDGSAGVSADIRFGSKIPILGWLPLPLIVSGIVLISAGAVMARRKKDA